MSEIKEYYKQRLPHIQTIGRTFFVTFRLHQSIHQSVIRELKQKYKSRLSLIENQTQHGHKKNYDKFKLRKELIVAYDHLLDNRACGPKYLCESKIAKICSEQFHKYDGLFYDLIAYTIMSNHVHLLIDTSIQIEKLNSDEDCIAENYAQLDKILRNIKGASARFANQELGRIGQFWARESFDIYIRDEKMLGNVINYIIENPVKAGVTNHWKEYKWTYLHPRYDQ